MYAHVMNDKHRKAITEAVAREAEAKEHIYKVLRAAMRDPMSTKTALSALMSELGRPMSTGHLRLVELGNAWRKPKRTVRKSADTQH
jgi:hypothetical protein